MGAGEPAPKPLREKAAPACPNALGPLYFVGQRVLLVGMSRFFNIEAAAIIAIILGVLVLAYIFFVA